MKLATKLKVLRRDGGKKREKEETHIDRTNDSPGEPVIYNEADEEDSGANEIAKREDERRGASGDTIVRTDS